MSFSQKTTARNLFRYKKRFFKMCIRDSFLDGLVNDTVDVGVALVGDDALRIIVHLLLAVFDGPSRPLIVRWLVFVPV